MMVINSEFATVQAKITEMRECRKRICSKVVWRSGETPLYPCPQQTDTHIPPIPSQIFFNRAQSMNSKFWKSRSFVYLEFYHYIYFMWVDFTGDFPCMTLYRISWSVRVPAKFHISDYPLLDSLGWDVRQKFSINKLHINFSVKLFCYWPCLCMREGNVHTLVCDSVDGGRGQTMSLHLTLPGPSTTWPVPSRPRFFNNTMKFLELFAVMESLFTVIQLADMNVCNSSQIFELDKTQN